MKALSNTFNSFKSWITVEKIQVVLFVLVITLFVLAAGAPESGGIFVR